MRSGYNWNKYFMGWLDKISFNYWIMQNNSEGNRGNKSVITNWWCSSLNLEHLRGAHFTLDRHMARGEWCSGGPGTETRTRWAWHHRDYPDVIGHGREPGDRKPWGVTMNEWIIKETNIFIFSLLAQGSFPTPEQGSVVRLQRAGVMWDFWEMIVEISPWELRL